MSQVQRIASWSFFFSLVLALWGAIYPAPYTLCMSLILSLPLIAIAVIGLSQGRLAVVGDGTQGSLFFVFLYTMGASAYRAYHDVQIFSKGKPVLYALLVAIVMELLLASVDPWFRKMWVLAVLLPVITFSYGIGSVLECDMLFDHSVPQKYVTRVLQRQINWGSRHKSYTVTLAPWGGRSDSITDLVTGVQYYSLSPGSEACVYVAPGALQIPWYKVQVCSGDAADAGRS